MRLVDLVGEWTHTALLLAIVRQDMSREDGILYHANIGIYDTALEALKEQGYVSDDFRFTDKALIALGEETVRRAPFESEAI